MHQEHAWLRTECLLSQKQSGVVDVVVINRSITVIHSFGMFRVRGVFVIWLYAELL